MLFASGHRYSASSGVPSQGDTGRGYCVSSSCDVMKHVREDVLCSDGLQLREERTFTRQDKICCPLLSNNCRVIGQGKPLQWCHCTSPSDTTVCKCMVSLMQTGQGINSHGTSFLYDGACIWSFDQARGRHLEMSHCQNPVASLCHLYYQC